jgi:hypothetical protein
MPRYRSISAKRGPKTKGAQKLSKQRTVSSKDSGQRWSNLMGEIKDPTGLGLGSSYGSVQHNLRKTGGPQPRKNNPFVGKGDRTDQLAKGITEAKSKIAKKVSTAKTDFVKKAKSTAGKIRSSIQSKVNSMSSVGKQTQPREPLMTSRASDAVTGEVENRTSKLEKRLRKAGRYGAAAYGGAMIGAQINKESNKDSI